MLVKEKVKYHLEMSIKFWHEWDEDLPIKVEVICNEVAKRHGKFLNVRHWLIVPSSPGIKECLVAETYAQNIQIMSLFKYILIT